MATREAGRLDDGDEGRYAGLTLDCGACVIYDRDNHQAWIQSKEVVPVRKFR